MSRSWIIMSRKRPPERVDVVHRRRAGISRDDRHDLDLADLARRRAACCTAAKLGSKRRLKPIISGFPASFTTARQARMRSEREIDRLLAEHGLAARAARSMRSACVSVGVQISDGVDVLVGDDRIDVCDPGARGCGEALGGFRQRVRHRNELGSRVGRDIAAVNAADAAGAEKSDANHGRRPLCGAPSCPVSCSSELDGELQPCCQCSAREYTFELTR